MSSIIMLIFVALIVAGIIKVVDKFIDWGSKNTTEQSAQQQQPAQQQQSLYLQHQQYYVAYCDAIIDCVINNYTAIDLCRPGNRPQHMAPGYSGVRVANLYGVVYCYRFDRRPELTSGGIGKAAVYSTFPVSQMMRKLNADFPNYCVSAGLVPHNIVDAQDIGNGKVEFTIA